MRELFTHIEWGAGAAAPAPHSPAARSAAGEETLRRHNIDKYTST